MLAKVACARRSRPLITTARTNTPASGSAAGFDDEGEEDESEIGEAGEESELGEEGEEGDGEEAGEEVRAAAYTAPPSWTPPPHSVCSRQALTYASHACRAGRRAGARLEAQENMTRPDLSACERPALLCERAPRRTARHVAAIGPD